MTQRIATVRRNFTLFGRLGAPTIALALGCLLLPGVLNADPVSAPPPEKPVIDAPTAPAAAPAEQPAADSDELKEAEARMRQAEVDYLRAKIDYEQLKGQHAIEALTEQLKSAQTELVRISPAVDQDGFIKKWLVAGPIPVDEKVGNHDEASCKEFLDKEYLNPQAMPKDGDTISTGDADVPLQTTAGQDFFVPLDTFAADQGKNPENAAFVGVVYVTCAQETPDVKLAVGSDDDSVWRLNGKEVIRVYEGRGVDKDQNTSEPLTLKQGVNVLSFTVLNGGGACAAAARFLDKDGNPALGLSVSVKPPAQ
jgi:hypothetical protein